MLFRRVHDQQVLAAEILWGVWLFALAVLLLRSRAFPRLLGYWLVVNGIAYLALSLAGLVFPQHAAFIAKVTLPALLGELVTMLWLVIRGAKAPIPVQGALVH